MANPSQVQNSSSLTVCQVRCTNMQLSWRLIAKCALMLMTSIRNTVAKGNNIIIKTRNFNPSLTCNFASIIYSSK